MIYRAIRVTFAIVMLVSISVRVRSTAVRFIFNLAVFAGTGYRAFILISFDKKTYRPSEMCYYSPNQ